jgi:hypothetical protein
MYSKENCDAVQTVPVSYGGFTQSDFMHPSYWNPRDLSGPWDYSGVLPGPFTLSPGGYMTIKQGTDGAVQSIYGSLATKENFKLSEHRRIQAIIAGRDKFVPVPDWLLDKQQAKVHLGLE